MHHDVDLTKKGEAYALCHLRPAGCPLGVEPAVWREALASRVEQHLAIVTGLLAVLDHMDPDPDLEDVDPDLEPSLGGFQISGEVDLEGDNSDFEPSLGWTPLDANSNQELIATEVGFDIDGEADILDEPHDEELGI